MVFQAYCDEIKLQKFSYDVIFVTSSSLRQPNDVTKITSQVEAYSPERRLGSASTHFADLFQGICLKCFIFWDKDGKFVESSAPKPPLASGGWGSVHRSQLVTPAQYYF